MAKSPWGFLYSFILSIFILVEYFVFSMCFLLGLYHFKNYFPGFSLFLFIHFFFYFCSSCEWKWSFISPIARNCTKCTGTPQSHRRTRFISCPCLSFQVFFFSYFILLRGSFFFTFFFLFMK